MTALADLITEAKGLKAKAERATANADQCWIDLGKALAQLKTRKPKGTTWPEFVREHFDYSKQRADQLIMMAEGKTTVEQERKKTAERVAKHAAKKRLLANSQSEPKRNPKKAGTPVQDACREIVRPLIGANKPTNSKKLAAEHGYSSGMFELAISAELARKNDPPIDASTLPGSMQEKLARAIAQHKRKLDDEMFMRIEARLQETVIPAYIKKSEELVRQIERRKGFMSKAQFNKIRMAIHPDTYRNLTTDERNSASQNWEKLKNVMVAEKENPVSSQYALPTSWDDLARRRPDVRATNGASGKETHANIARRK